MSPASRRLGETQRCWGPERPLQPPHRLPKPPRDEDEAYDEWRQKELDEEQENETDPASRQPHP